MQSPQSPLTQIKMTEEACAAQVREIASAVRQVGRNSLPEALGELKVECDQARERVQKQYSQAISMVAELVRFVDHLAFAIGDDLAHQQEPAVVVPALPFVPGECFLDDEDAPEVAPVGSGQLDEFLEPTRNGDSTSETRKRRRKK